MNLKIEAIDKVKLSNLNQDIRELIKELHSGLKANYSTYKSKLFNI